MTRQETATCSFCIEEELMNQIERVRQDHEKDAGYLSRSAILRLLLRRGLATVSDRKLLDEPRAAQ